VPRAASRPLPRRSCRTLGNTRAAKRHVRGPTSTTEAPSYLARLSRRYCSTRARGACFRSRRAIPDRAGRSINPERGASVKRRRMGQHGRLACCRKCRLGRFVLHRLRLKVAIAEELLGGAMRRGRGLPCLLGPRPISGYAFPVEDRPLVTRIATCHCRRRLASSLGCPEATCRLSPPSSGHSKGRCAPFAPPLMSNVRRHNHPHQTMVPRLLRWLFVEPRHFWVALLIPALLVAYAVFVAKSEAFLRLSGLALQLLGILTAVWGIFETWKFFKLGDPLAKLRQWFQRCPLRRPRVVTGVGLATEQGDSMSARGHTWWAPKPEASLEERVAILEKNIPLLNERISSTQGQLDGAVRNLHAGLKQAEEAVQQVSANLDSRLTDFGTGSLHISAIGAFWLFVGSILGTASQEILGALR